MLYSFTWIWEKQAPLFEKIALSISALTPWSRAIIKSPRTDLLLQMILFYTLLIILIKHFITNKKCTTISTIVTLFLGIRVLFPKYTYLHNSGDVHFWKIGLTAASFVTITFIVLTIKQKIHLQNNRIPEKICSYLLVFRATFVLAAYTIANLNYALDHSKSIAYPATVLKKEIRSGTRGATSYVLITNINNEKKNSMYQNQHILMYI